jgi:hypothetical protein
MYLKRANKPRMGILMTVEVESDRYKPPRIDNLLRRTSESAVTNIRGLEHLLRSSAEKVAGAAVAVSRLGKKRSGIANPVWTGVAGAGGISLVGAGFYLSTGGVAGISLHDPILDTLLFVGIVLTSVGIAGGVSSDKKSREIDH